MRNNIHKAHKAFLLYANKLLFQLFSVAYEVAGVVYDEVVCQKNIAGGAGVVFMPVFIRPQLQSRFLLVYGFSVNSYRLPIGSYKEV